VTEESSAAMSPSTDEVMLCRRLLKKPPLLVVPPVGMTLLMKFCPMREVLSWEVLVWRWSGRRTDG
jgi:hypothetical protein